MPLTVKIIVFCSILLGFWARSCWRANELENIIFENIVLENYTPVSVEVTFEVMNNTRQSRRKPVLIGVYTSDDVLIASRITTVELVPMQRREHVVIMENFHRPLREGEVLGFARVALYQRPMF